MKHLVFGFILLTATFLVSAQTVRIVDNNFNAPTGPEVYGTLQAAVDAASPGDLIYVQPSPTAYGNVNIETPNLTIMGIGWNLTKDLAYTSTVGNIILRNNNANTTNASGTKIMGLRITYIYLGTTQTGSYLLSDVIIDNNAVDYIVVGSGSYVNSDNILISDNMIYQYISCYKQHNNMVIRNNNFRANSLNVQLLDGPHNITIGNNILFGYVDARNASDQILIDHNNFIGSNSSTNYSFSYLYNDIVTNNIFYGQSPRANNTNYGNVFNNNLAYGSSNNTLPPAASGGVNNTGTGNIEDLVPSFVNAELLNTWSSAYDYTLNPGSPALAGSAQNPSSEDIGITGGTFALTGSTINFQLDTSPMPTIEAFNTSVTINPNDDLPVNIKAKGN